MDAKTPIDARAQNPSFVGNYLQRCKQKWERGVSSLKFFISAGVRKFVII